MFVHFIQVCCWFVTSTWFTSTIIKCCFGCCVQKKKKLTIIRWSRSGVGNLYRAAGQICVWENFAGGDKVKRLFSGSDSTNFELKTKKRKRSSPRRTFQHCVFPSISSWRSKKVITSGHVSTLPFFLQFRVEDQKKRSSPRGTSQNCRFSCNFEKALAGHFEGLRGPQVPHPWFKVTYCSYCMTFKLPNHADVTCIFSLCFCFVIVYVFEMLMTHSDFLLTMFSFVWNENIFKKKLRIFSQIVVYDADCI